MFVDDTPGPATRTPQHLGPRQNNPQMDGDGSIHIHYQGHILQAMLANEATSSKGGMIETNIVNRQNLLDHLSKRFESVLTVQSVVEAAVVDERIRPKSQDRLERESPRPRIFSLHA